MTEIYYRKGEGVMKCENCFPGRLHLILDYPEKEFPASILETVASVLNPLGFRLVLLDK